jgi:hypothetical protein
MATLYGFTLLRNGVKYDYSFKECLLSLSAVTKKTYLALGKGEDDTEKEVSGFNFLKIIPTVWDDNLREGGIILSQQTNIALNELKNDKKAEHDSWGMYLQCDEVIHEEDYKLIARDLEKAEESGCDAISFRYLHFWQTHHHIAINKKWYPQEIRAVKLNTNIESWGDAQSFKNHTKVYQSEAKIFHYGHVREEKSYKNKKEDILKRYHSEEKLAKYQKREKKFDDLTAVLNFLGTHPQVMKERILRMGGVWDWPAASSVCIVGADKKLISLFENKINAEKIYWKNSLNEVSKEMMGNLVILKANWIHRRMYKSTVPKKMKSKIALEWSQEMILTLKLSEKEISLKN